MALDQTQSEVNKKGSDSDRQRYVRKSRFQRGGKEPALEQERPKWEERDRPSADGREAERRGGRKRNGCCLSEASFIHFPTAAKRSSPAGAALNFWFFWVKPKERNIPIQKQQEMKTFYITLITSILLIVGGFICPPMGIIDSSVLTAVGLLLAFATLAQVPTLMEAARNGQRIRLTKGDFSAEVSSENPPD